MERNMLAVNHLWVQVMCGLSFTKNVRNWPQSMMLGIERRCCFPTWSIRCSTRICGRLWNAAQLLLGRPRVRFLWGVNWRLERLLESLLEMLCAPCARRSDEIVCLFVYTCMHMYISIHMRTSQCLHVYIHVVTQVVLFRGGSSRTICCRWNCVLGVTRSTGGVFETHLWWRAGKW